jgi:hypothetical protein
MNEERRHLCRLVEHPLASFENFSRQDAGESRQVGTECVRSRYVVNLR